ncbi:unnamed protein product [Schistocephalus solidus]|uniref:Rho-GAP domain-containing protein n=1 Tax=Schistocephalus solidus TaxID=70667 RepID=A0A183TK09_SCHSO|nr:unnamed protein product [Schistocephalus solidus]
MNVCRFSFSRTYAPHVIVSCEDYVCIPRNQPLTWLLSRLILTHGIPKFAEKGKFYGAVEDQNLEETAALIAKGGSDEAVSELQRRFHSDYEILKTQWDSRISELKELQRRNYRSFVMSVEEQLPQSLSPPAATVGRGVAPSSKVTRLNATPSQILNESAKTPHRGSITHAPMSPHEPRSESFMVELGRQLRTSYNLKLIQADPLNLITIVGSGLSGPPSESPVSPAIRTVNLAERLSSALTIYSNQLTGLIILVNSQFFQSRDQRRKSSL